MAMPRKQQLGFDIAIGAGDNDLEKVQAALEAGGDPDFKSHETSQPPINSAALRNYPRMVKLLLDNGADPEQVDTRENETALLSALRHDMLETVEILLKHGVNIEARNSEGQNALEKALYFGNDRCAELLSKETAAPKPRSKAAASHDLLIAASRGDIEGVQKALDKKADINFTSQVGKTAFLYALQTKEPEMLRLLVEHGANMKARDRKGDGTMEYLSHIYNAMAQKECTAILQQAGFSKPPQNMSPMELYRHKMAQRPKLRR